MKVIDFEAKKRERESKKRYDYILSMIQLGQQELFDKLIEEEEAALTTEKEESCGDFIGLLQKRGHDPSIIFEEVTFVPEEEFYEEHQINWYIAIEEALTYYAVLRKHDKDKYNIVLELHPFVGSF